MTGSFTQWVAACRCEQIERGKGELQICAICGKQIDKGNTGSFTQWALQSQNCSCENPVPLDSNMSSMATPAISETAFKPVRKTVEEEIGDLGVDSFPLERYKPLDKLGAGGGGAVYLCFDKHLRKNVAVKISFAKLNEDLVNFQSEAKVTAKFKHPNIVSIIDFGLTPAGAPFMVLEYVDGLSLDKYIQEKGHIDERLAIPIFVQIASALEKGHESGIFHRDMKSSNIIIKNEGKNGEPFARIIDFGIALMTGQETTKFHGKNIIGTPKYMSPDQLSGRTFDARSEIYSFGCVMYECLTGSLPFKGDALSLLDMHTKMEPPPFASVAPDVRISSYMERLVRRCLEKDPDMRFNTVKDLKEALQRTDGDDIIESSSVQTVIDPSLFKNSNAGESPTMQGDSEAVTRRIAFDNENRRRALTDDLAIPSGLQTQLKNSNEVNSGSKSKTHNIAITLVVVAIVVIVGVMVTAAVILLHQEPESVKKDESTTEQPAIATASSTAGTTEDFSKINDVDAIRERVAPLERNHQYKDAEAAYSRLIELMPSKAEFYRLRGLARQHQGEYTLAIRDLDEANRLHDIDGANLRARAEYYLDCTEYEKAAKDVTFALDLEPEKVDNLLLLARIQIAKNTPPDEIEKTLNKAIKLSPESGLAHALRSNLYSQMKRPLDAEKDMDKAIEYSGNDPHVYYYRAAASALKSDMDHAILYMNKAIKLAPYMWQAYLGRAKIYAARDGEEQAIDDFEKAMSVNPKNADICAAAAQYYLSKELSREARRSVDKAIQLDPRGEYYVLRAEINLHQGKQSDAVTDCQDAIKAGVKGARIYRMYGTALTSEGKFKEAEAAFTTALKDDPKFVNALAQRAQVREKLGENDKALLDLTEALRLAPDDIRCRQRRADLYDRLGKPDLAAKDRSMPKREYGNLFNPVQGKDK